MAPSRGAEHAAEQIQAALAAEQAVISSAHSAKRDALQSAANAQAEQIIAASQSETTAAMHAITQRQQAAHSTFTQARQNIASTRAAEVELARNDAKASEQRLRDGTSGLGARIKEVASSEGTRMKLAAQGSVDRCDASGMKLGQDINAITIDPHSVASDLDSDEVSKVNQAVEEAKASARGALWGNRWEVRAKLGGTAMDNENAFRDAADDIAQQINDALPEQFDAIHETGDATVGLINAMAASQLSAIDQAEHQTMGALNHAKAEARNIQDAGQITSAQVRSNVVGQITGLNNHEAAASRALAAMADQALSTLHDKGSISYLEASQAAEATKSALKSGSTQVLGILDDSAGAALGKVNDAAAAYTGAVGGQRDKLLGAVDGALAQSAGVLTQANTDLDANCKAFRAAAVTSYVGAETTVYSKAAPEIAKAESDWKSQASAFIASCQAYESEQVAKHGEVRAGMHAQLTTVAQKTVSLVRRSRAEKIWDGVTDALSSFGTGVAIFVVGVIIVAGTIIAVFGTAFAALALAIAVVVVGAVMLAVGLLLALYNRFKQLWNNDWPWYVKILGIPAAFGVAVGDMFGFSQVVEWARGRELISERELSTQERAQRGTEGALQFITFGLIKALTRSSKPPPGRTPAGGRGGRGVDGGTETAPPPDTTTTTPKPGETTTTTAEPPKTVETPATSEPPKTETSPATTTSEPPKPTAPEPAKPEPQKTQPDTSEPQQTGNPPEPKTTADPTKTTEPPATTPEPTKTPPENTQKPADATKVEEPSVKEPPKPAESPFKAEAIEKSKSYARGAAKKQSDKFDFKNDPDAQAAVENTWRDAFNEEYAKRRQAGESDKIAVKEARKAADQAAKDAAMARSAEPQNIERARERARADHDADNQFEDNLDPATKKAKDAYDAGTQGGRPSLSPRSWMGRPFPRWRRSSTAMRLPISARSCRGAPPMESPWTAGSIRTARLSGSSQRGPARTPTTQCTVSRSPSSPDCPVRKMMLPSR